MKCNLKRLILNELIVSTATAHTFACVQSSRRWWVERSAAKIPSEKRKSRRLVWGKFKVKQRKSKNSTRLFEIQKWHSANDNN